VIASGLKAQERIIVDGVQKARPGMKVNPKTVLIEEEKDVSTAAAPTESAGSSAASASGGSHETKHEKKD
jgi:hypothetical protein